MDGGGDSICTPPAWMSVTGTGGLAHTTHHSHGDWPLYVWWKSKTLLSITEQILGGKCNSFVELSHGLNPNDGDGLYYHSRGLVTSLQGISARA